MAVQQVRDWLGHPVSLQRAPPSPPGTLTLTDIALIIADGLKSFSVRAVVSLFYQNLLITHNALQPRFYA